jgi:cytochrome c biogenesis protein CcmG/thiol:disulfide interchange protein DsbE
VGLAIVVIAVALNVSLGRPNPSLIVVAGNPLVGRPAPEISLQTADGETVSLSSLRGRPVIVNFWASWCIPCREEFPLLVDAYERHSGEGLEILGVIHDDGPEAATEFANSFGATWPMLNDVDDVAWRAYMGAFLPVTYFVDREGVIQSVSYGAPPSGFLDDEIEKIL